MVRHIILWKLKEDKNTLEIKQNAKNALEALAGKIDGLIDIKVHINPLASSNTDMMLDSLFESEQALKNYAVHPLHVAAADTFVRPNTSQRSCLDFEVE